MRSLYSENQIENSNAAISMAIVAGYVSLVLINIYKVIEPEFNIPISYVSIFLFVILSILSINAMKKVYNRLHKTQIIFIIFSILILIFNVLVFPENNAYFLESSRNYIFRPFLITILLLSCSNLEVLMRYFSVSMQITSFLVLLLNIFYLNKINPLNYELAYFMGLSNALIFPSLFMFFDILTKRNIKTFICNSILLVSNFLFIVLKGSRGAILVIVIGCIILLFKHNINKKIKIMLGATMSFLLAFWKEVLLFISSIAYIYDISSRTLTQLIEDAAYGSSRSILQKSLISDFLNSPFDIRGINADYVVNQIYAHNLFIEIFYDLGIIIGSLFSILIIICSIWTICHKCKNDYDYFLLLLFISSFPLLMLSSSFFVEISFIPWFVSTLCKAFSHRALLMK